MFSTNLSTIRKMSSSPSILANTKQDFESSGAQKSGLDVSLESNFCFESNNLAKSFGNSQELNNEKNLDLRKISKVKKNKESAKTKDQVKAKGLEQSKEAVKNNIGSSVTLEKTNTGSSVTLEKTNIGSSVTLEKTNIGSSVTLEKTNIGSSVTLEKANIGSSVTLEKSGSNSMLMFGLVNGLLADIALSKRNIAFIETAFAQECANLRLLAEKRASKDKKQLEELEERLQNLVQENRIELFGTKKTLNLSFGSVAFREVTKIVPIEGWSWEGVLACLENNSMHNFIRQKREVDKLALKSLAKNTLLHLGCESQQCENFSYQTTNNFLR